MSRSSMRWLFEAMKLAPDLSGIDQDFGEDRVFFNDRAPRVVWVPPDREGFIPPDGRSNDSLGNPRVIWMRTVPVLVYCHGVSNLADAKPEDHTEVVECLAFSRVMPAIHRQMFKGYSYTPLEMTWMKEDGETLKYGRVAVLLIEFRFAVTMPESQSVEIEDIPITTEVQPILVPGP